MKRSVRIGSARLQGRRLTPRGCVRPTASRVREALLDIWARRLSGCRFLDLFAGTGAVGLEALSRGAATVVFVEADRRRLRHLDRTCRKLPLEGTRVIQGDLPRDLERLRDQLRHAFDLIFADPPYRFEAYRQLLAGLDPWFAEGGELAIEHDKHIQLPERVGRLYRVDVRRYGDSCLSFYQQQQPERR